MGLSSGEALTIKMQKYPKAFFKVLKWSLATVGATATVLVLWLVVSSAFEAQREIAPPSNSEPSSLKVVEKPNLEQSQNQPPTQAQEYKSESPAAVTKKNLPKTQPPPSIAKPVLNPITPPAAKTFKYFTQYNSPIFLGATSNAQTPTSYNFFERNTEIVLEKEISSSDKFTPVMVNWDGSIKDVYILTASLGEASIAPVPPADREELAKAVVQIRCPVNGSFHNGVLGSGVVITPTGRILSVAHVIDEPVDEDATVCDVIFPLKNPETGIWQARAYYKAKIIDKAETIATYNATGRDIAYLQMVPTEANFIPSQYPYLERAPYVPYKFCDGNILEDKMLAIGFAQNISLNALSFYEGKIFGFADISMAIPLKPLQYSYDLSVPHQFASAIIGNLSGGASGGLAFNTDQNCIIGVHSSVGTGSDNRVFEHIAIP